MFISSEHVATSTKESDTDVAKAFPTEEAVNDALRSLIELAQKSIGLTRRSTEHAKKQRSG